MPFPLTDEQRKIVDDRGGELLVSAAAGSGKTRVLVERLLDRVTDEGLDIDRFLVITYTKAAAAELRGRIAQEISDRLAERPNDRHLRRQTTLIYRAQISTIHAFCTAFLRESGHLLDLDPDFRVCDEGEANILKLQALEQVLDQRYEKLSAASPFAQLADTLGAGRDDSRLVQIALDIHGRIQSHPDPARWLEEQKTTWELENISDLSQTIWGGLLLEDARRQAAFCRERMACALSLTEGDELLELNYAPSISSTLDSLEKLIAARTWDGAAACLPIAFPTVGRKKKRGIELSPMEEQRAAQAAERVKMIRTKSKKLMEETCELLAGDTAALLEELALSRPAVQALMELVLDFQAAYQKEKSRRGLLDFSDLEHMTVKLLLDQDGQPSELARFWSGRYDEVLVDEYQDTNQVQNAIFTAISERGRRLFQVGDVKQSIYRFRLADPTIFLNKYRRFPEGDRAEPGQPRKRVLSRNFRSRVPVLEGCNDLFRSIMSTGFGEVDYSNDQALVPGKPFQGEEDEPLELDILDLSFLGDQEGEKESKDLLEARFAVRRIQQLLKRPLLIEDEGALRPVRPGDFMLLLRSPGSVLHHYIRAFGEAGVPWVADGGEDFFATTEVNVALAILQIVDNPRQDVPLLAALRSPVFDFSADKLAMLRAGCDGDFYAALVQGAETGDEQCERFLRQLEQLRFGAGDRTCRQLIWHIYEQTNLLGIFGAMEAGAERQSNLLSLYALAGQLEESGCRTLFQFLLRLERLRASGARLMGPSAAQGGDGVSILSIHRSKGLEKPVVLVCGLTRRLNQDDLMRPVLFHPELGVGPKGLDRGRMVEYDTLARRAVKRRLKREMMAEELRLLYVAMTRAREKLILTLALPEGARGLTRLGAELSLPIPPLVLEQQQNVGQWVLLHALTRPEAESLRALANAPDVVAEGLGPAWDIRWVEGQVLGNAEEQSSTLNDLPEVCEEDVVRAAVRLRWQYPYLADTDLPSKLTATQLKGRDLDREVAEETRPASRKGQPINRPNFIAQERGLTPAQRGIALHLALEYLDIQGDVSEKGVAAQLDALTKQGFLTQLQRKSVKEKGLSVFLSSPLGREMAQADRCQREFKFSLLVPAQEYFSRGSAGEEVLLQGVIDAWFERDGKLTVVDFKTDRIAPGGERARAEEYRVQLDTYTRALSAILGKPVSRRVLWFFATNTMVEL